MNKLTAILLCTISYACANGQVAKNIIVEHFTNTYCSVCANRNPGFYNNLHQFPEVLHIAYHPSAPYIACPLNQHNKTENDERTNFYGIYGSTPRIVIQGNVIPANANYNDAALFQSQQGQTSVYELHTTLTQTTATDLEVQVSVIKTMADTLQEATLYAVIAEDTLFFNADNGESMHFDVFRKAVFGAPMHLTLPSDIGDSVSFTQTVAIHPVWSRNRIYAIALLQHTDQSVLQASGSNHLPYSTSVVAPGVGTFSIYPNPVQNELHIDPADNKPYTSYIYNMEGKQMLWFTVASDKQVPVSNLAPGMYYLHIVGSGFEKHTSFIKL